ERPGWRPLQSRSGGAARCALTHGFHADAVLHSSAAGFDDAQRDLVRSWVSGPVLRRDRFRLHAGRGLADAAADRLLGPSYSQPLGRSLLAALVERPRQPLHTTVPDRSHG